MNKLKNFVKKYFEHFVFFYRYLGYRVFVALVLSLAVGVLDGFGLIMFLPLLQIVMGNAEGAGEGLGGMSFIVDGLSYVGISLTLGSVLTLMTVFFGLKAIAKFIQMYYTVKVRLFFVRNVRFKMADKMANYSYKSFVQADAGRIQNTMSGEVNRVQQAYNSYFATIESWVLLLVYFGLALVTTFQFSILVALGGALSNVIYKRIYKKTKDNSSRISRGGHTFQRLLIQKVAFFKYLKATGFMNAYNKKLKEAVLYIEEASRKIGLYNAILSSSREPLMLIVMALVIFAQSVIFEAQLDGIILSLLFFYRAMQYILAVQNSWNAFLGSSGALTNLSEFIVDLDANQEKRGTIIFNGFTKEIKIDNVDFYYGESQVLRQIQITIARNKTIAFVGESGSGKTTLVNLLTGLMPVDNGQITIDGVRYRDLDLRTLQQRIGYITQDPVIFSDSVYDNITKWAPKTPENVTKFWSILEKAAIADFVRQLPLAEDSLLGNNGIQVSGGQKQRLSIARELYREVDILVMDEATSALDSETERAIQENIEALKGKYTILIVAHRLSTIKDADEIFLLNKGALVASGNYQELAAKSETFRRMTSLQEV